MILHNYIFAFSIYSLYFIRHIHPRIIIFEKNLYLIFFLILFLVLIFSKKLFINKFLILPLFVFFLSMILGLFSNNYFNVFKDVVIYGNFFLLFIYADNFKSEIQFILYKYSNLIVILLFLPFIISPFVSYYLSLQRYDSLIIPIIVFTSFILCFKRNIFTLILSFIIFMLILFSNVRISILLLLFSIILVFLNGKKEPKESLLLILIIFLFFLFFSYFIFYFNTRFNFLYTLQYYNIFDWKYLVSIGELSLAVRFLEIRDVILPLLNSGSLSLFFGVGLGANIDYSYDLYNLLLNNNSNRLFNSNLYYRNIHNGPVDLYIRFGFIYLFFFILIFIKNFIDCFKVQTNSRLFITICSFMTLLAHLFSNQFLNIGGLLLVIFYLTNFDFDDYKK